MLSSYKELYILFDLMFKLQYFFINVYIQLKTCFLKYFKAYTNVLFIYMYKYGGNVKPLTIFLLGLLPIFWYFFFRFGNLKPLANCRLLMFQSVHRQNQSYTLRTISLVLCVQIIQRITKVIVHTESVMFSNETLFRGFG